MSIEEVLVEKAADLVIKYIAPIANSIRDVVAQRKLREDIASRKAFSEYYKTVIQRHSITKTILYRTNPVNLYNFYVNLDLKADSEVITTDTTDFVQKCGRRLLITGSAGSGKSTLLKHLFLQSIRDGLGVPLFTELRNLQSVTQGFEFFLVDSARSLHLDIPRDVLLTLLRNGRFVLFLDGFDELSPSISNRIAYELTDFFARHSNVIAIMTSRPSHGFIGWSQFRELQLLPMSKTTCLALINKLDYDPSLKSVFAAAVDERLYSSHESFLSNPLLATLMLMTFEQYGNIEQQMHLFYGQAFDTLYMKHDATKIGYRRHMSSRLNTDDFRAAVAAFCVQTYLASTLSFTQQQALEYATKCPEIVQIRGEFDAEALLKDLVGSVCVLVQDGLQLTFAHRSFQEYFAALFLLNYSQSRRRQLLALLKPRLVTDTTAKMVFDMNQPAFEEDFLRDAIVDLRKFARWAGDRSRESALTFIQKTIVPLRVTAEACVLGRITDRVTNYLNLIAFVEERYYGHQLAMFSPDKPTALFDIVSELRAPELARVQRVSPPQAKRAMRVTGAMLENSDINNEAVQQAMLDYLAPLVDALDRALRLLDRISSHRFSQEEAIDALLLDRRKRTR